MPSPVHVVAGVLRDTAARVLIQQRPPGKQLAGYWEFPGGKVHDGEAAWDALVRELHEELGITAQAGQPLISLHHTYPQSTVRLELWDVEHWSGAVRSRENQALRWLAVRDLDGRQLLPADIPVISALRLPQTHLVTPDICAQPGNFLKTLSGAVRAHQLRLVTLRQTSYADPEYHRLACAVVRELAPLGCAVLLHGNPGERLSWVDEIGAGGFHLRASDLISTATWRRKGRWLAMSCHNREQLRQAADIGVDFGVLGSVVSTASHPGVQPLGWQRFGALVEEVNFPVYAIGGMRLSDLGTSRAAGGQGISAIRSLWM